MSRHRLGLIAGLGIGVTATWDLDYLFRLPLPAAGLTRLGLGAVGAQLGTRTPLPVWGHQALMRFGAATGAIGGVLLGVAVVHGIPARGEFGVPVVACSAGLGFLGFLLPIWALARLVPVRCPGCDGGAFLRTEATFVRNMLAPYAYRCPACGHFEPASFNRFGR